MIGQSRGASSGRSPRTTGSSKGARLLDAAPPTRRAHDDLQHGGQSQDHWPSSTEVLDMELLELCAPGPRARREGRDRAADPQREPHRGHDPRLRGLAWRTARRAARGHDPLRFKGSAGQSLGAFCPKGMTFEVDGDTNDYAGKGLCGGQDDRAGAGGGDLRPGGEHHHRQRRPLRRDRAARPTSTVAGERFCVRNSGADDRGRRRGRPRLRVHDWRHRRDPRSDRVGTSAPA